MRYINLLLILTLSSRNRSRVLNTYQVAGLAKHPGMNVKHF